MSESPYQLLPPLTDDEYAALKDSIAEHGVYLGGSVPVPLSRKNAP